MAGRVTHSLVDQTRSIDRDYLIGDPVDYFSVNATAQVELALTHYLGIVDGSRRHLQ